jgi:hypothetical protein
MFCTTCGAQVPAGSAYCHNCGRPALAVRPGSGAAPGSVAGAPQREPKAIASLVCGILGLTIFSILAGIPAIILGHTARKRIAESMGSLSGAGVALAGLIMGYLSLAVTAAVLIALLGGPHRMQSWSAPNESSGAMSVRQIVIATETYFSMYPQRGYPERLSDLGGQGMEPSETNAGMLEEMIAGGGPKDGYVFSYEARDEQGDGFREDYFVRADPVNARGRSYCTNSQGILRSEPEGACTLESPPVQ